MSRYTEPGEWCSAYHDALYRTTKPLVWEVGCKGSGLAVTVPADWLFDVSVPTLFRWAFSPHDPRYLKAAALHDWLLCENWSRVTAAAEFHEALRADGVGVARRLLMWLAVSLWRWS